jgi:2-C-methyl-D-erythritol 4-phosphate cytidylyltransferase
VGQIWAIVVAAGTGTRFGGAKQFALLDGRRVVDWSVAAAKRSCDQVVLVGPSGAEIDDTNADVVVDGGDTRSASVRAGLTRVPGDAGIVVVHDAARPLAGDELFARVIDAVRKGADGALPGVPLTDTVVRVEGDEPVETLDRSRLVAVQTPQAFTADGLRRAHACNPDATDDAQLVQRLGGRVVVVEGDPSNVKVTRASDLAVAAALVQR